MSPASRSRSMAATLPSSGSLRDVYIVDAVRTPIGKAGGAMARIRPDDLGATVIRALLERQPRLDPARIDEVFMGAANQSGEDNRNVARMSALLAGLPPSVPGTTVNRLCASGLDAVIGAMRAIRVGDGSIYIAGGVESMSRAPWVVPKPQRAFPSGNESMFSTTLGWRMVNPVMPDEWTVSLGEATELLAARFGISREASDEFAAASHQRASAAWASGVFESALVVPAGVPLDRDEGIRDGASPETLAKLPTVFRPDGVVTAGNASQISDGAASLLLADEDGVAELGVEPLARLTAVGIHAVEPQYFGVGPVEAVRRALQRAGRKLVDVSVLELNEAFAAQSLACLGEWPELDPALVNPNGGAISMGHPLGCSGARLAGAVAHQLATSGNGVGVASLCVGVGQGVAVVLER
jgi:acetyl-CoA acetyltransferase family protein